jgi:TIR domain
MVEAMARKVFISYRRDDTRYQAHRIHTAFCKTIPSDHVFMDVDSIPPGENFRKILEEWVNQCEVLLALIGPGWIDARDMKTKGRRLDNKNDFVRIEIGEALARNIPVVPVLIDDAPMPDVDLLPDDLKELVDRQAVFVEYRTFDADVERLIRKLRLSQDIGPRSDNLAAAPQNKPRNEEAKAEAREAPDAPDATAGEVTVRLAREPSNKMPEYYVSYAWGDDTTEGKEREAVLDRLCAEAHARGKCIIRDKTAMKIGNISTFMNRIGKGVADARVCIVLSDKYLKSPYCMHELFDVWRNCREDSDTFIDRTRVLVLPSAKISTAVERTQYVIHWQSAFKSLDALVRAHGKLALSDKDHTEFWLMSRFVSETANVLQWVQDTLRPRSFDDLVNHVLD